MNNENVITGNKEIDEAYDALLSIGDNAGKLNEEQIEKLSKVMENNLTEDELLMRKINSGEMEMDVDYSDESDQSTTQYVSIDPVTGKAMNIQQESGGNNDLQNALDLDGDLGDMDEYEITEESISAAITKTYGTELGLEDLSSIMEQVKRFHNGETIKFKDMPISIRTKITSTILNDTDSGSRNNIGYAGNIELLDQMARVFIEGIAMEAFQTEIQSVYTDLNESITNYVKDEMGATYSNSAIAQREIMETKLIDIATKIEEEKPEEAKQLRDISSSFIHSYTYDDMYRTFRDTGKLRIKKIDIEKYSKIYSEFNYKYAKSKWSIRDLTMLEPILDRHLPDYINMDDIRKFLIVFCKYCRNYKPENIDQHTFMYYFVTNICSLDIYDKTNEVDKKFYNELIDNIINFIELIIKKESRQTI